MLIVSVRVIALDIQCKDDNARLTAKPLKAFLVKSDISVYNLKNWLYSVAVSLLQWLALFYYKKTYRNYQNQTPEGHSK